MDTGNIYGILAAKVLRNVFAKEPGFKKYSLLNEGGIVKHYFNSSAYEGGWVSVMAFGVEGSEWLVDITYATSDFSLKFIDGSLIGVF